MRLSKWVRMKTIWVSHSPYGNGGFRKTRGPSKIKEAFAGTSGEEPLATTIGTSTSVLLQHETWDWSQHKEGQREAKFWFEILKPKASEAKPTYRGQPDYIICRVSCKIKIQTPCSKVRGKVPLKILKHKAFSLPFKVSLSQLLVVFLYLLLNAILNWKTLKLWMISVNFCSYLYMVLDQF